MLETRKPLPTLTTRKFRTDFMFKAEPDSFFPFLPPDWVFQQNFKSADDDFKHSDFLRLGNEKVVDMCDFINKKCPVHNQCNDENPGFFKRKRYACKHVPEQSDMHLVGCFARLHALWTRNYCDAFQKLIEAQIVGFLTRENVLGHNGMLVAKDEVHAVELSAQGCAAFIARPTAKGYDRLWDKVTREFEKVNKEFNLPHQHDDLPFHAEREWRSPTGWVYDINGVTIVFDSVDHLKHCFEALLLATWQGDGLQVLKARNGFHCKEKAPSGYRDVKLYIVVNTNYSPGTTSKLHDDFRRCRSYERYGSIGKETLTNLGLDFSSNQSAKESNPMVVEMQLQLKRLSFVKPLSHLPYEICRGDMEHDTYKSLWKQMYDHARKLLLAMENENIDSSQLCHIISEVRDSVPACNVDLAMRRAEELRGFATTDRENLWASQETKYDANVPDTPYKITEDGMKGRRGSLISQNGLPAMSSNEVAQDATHEISQRQPNSVFPGVALTTNRIRGSLKVQNIDYAVLISNEVVKRNVEVTCKSQIAAAASTTASSVDVTLRPGSVVVSYEIQVPTQAAKTTQATLISSLSSTFSNDLVTELNMIPGIHNIVSGSLSIVDISVPQIISSAGSSNEPWQGDSPEVAKPAIYGKDVRNRKLAKKLVGGSSLISQANPPAKPSRDGVQDDKVCTKAENAEVTSQIRGVMTIQNVDLTAFISNTTVKQKVVPSAGVKLRL